MANWENKLIAEKLDSLQQLPEGYNPDLTSKWEIIEAGLPKQKKKIAPLFMWAAAAAIIGIVFYTSIISFYEGKKTIAVQLPANKTITTAIDTALNNLNKKQKNKAVERIENIALKNNKTIKISSNDKTLLNKKVIKELIKTEIPILNNTSVIAINNLMPVTAATLVATIKTETIKPAKSKIFQKDFVEEVLTMDKPNITTNQHVGFRIQLNKTTTGQGSQYAPALQWEKSF